MRFVKTKDYNDMSRKAANVISAQMIEKPDCVLGLATGSTPIGLYKCLPHENDQSYYYFMNDNLFSHVNIDVTKTHVPDGTIADADEACNAYEEIIASVGGVDIQLLGMGHNGHIGFNEPADTFAKKTNCVQLAESTINANARFFASKEDVPTQAYTMGIGTIMAAKKILVVVSGADKADIVEKAFFGPVTPQVPASILQFHPDVTVVGDEAAFAKIADRI